MEEEAAGQPLPCLRGKPAVGEAATGDPSFQEYFYPLFKSNFTLFFRNNFTLYLGAFCPENRLCFILALTLFLPGLAQAATSLCSPGLLAAPTRGQM